MIDFENIRKKYNLVMTGLDLDMVRESYGDSQQKQIQKPRYGLAVLVGQKIRYQAIMLPGFKTKAKFDGKEIPLRTLININHKGKLVADHIQINLYGTEHYTNKKWDIEESAFTKRIDIVGVVYEYGKGDDKKYSIALTEKPRFQDDKMMIDTIMDYAHNTNSNIYENISRRGLVDCELNIKKQVIRDMRNTLNKLTMYELPKDFMWNYLINQFTLNSLSIYMHNQNIDLYLDQLTTLQCDLLITILSYLLTIMESNQEIFKIYEIFRLIVILCSKAQGIKTFEDHDDYFNRFCCRFDMSDSEGKRGWSIIKYRIKNYKLVDEDLDFSHFEKFASTCGWTRALCVAYYIQKYKKI